MDCVQTLNLVHMANGSVSNFAFIETFIFPMVDMVYSGIMRLQERKKKCYSASNYLIILCISFLQTFVNWN